MDRRFNALGQPGKLCVPQCGIRTEKHRVNQRNGIQRFACGGFYTVGL